MYFEDLVSAHISNSASVFCTFIFCKSLFSK